MPMIETFWLIPAFLAGAFLAYLYARNKFGGYDDDRDN